MSYAGYLIAINDFPVPLKAMKTQDYSVVREKREVARWTDANGDNHVELFPKPKATISFVIGERTAEQQASIRQIFEQTENVKVVYFDSTTALYRTGYFEMEPAQIDLNAATEGNVFFADTEIVLNSYIAWGNECFNKFTGMFALAIYDRLKNTMVLARDRVGEKPLYYYKGETTISFASEIKVLLYNSDRQWKINPQALKSYLYFNCIQGEQSILENINRLLPGYYAEINLNTFEITTKAYWKLPQFNENGKNLNELL